MHWCRGHLVGWRRAHGWISACTSVRNFIVVDTDAGEVRACCRWRSRLKEGPIHRARLSRGAVIPAHTHPADEYVMVLNGAVETGGRRCEAGTFWITPAGTRQGPHTAVTDAELLTVRLARWGLSASKAAFIHSSNTGYC